MGTIQDKLKNFRAGAASIAQASIQNTFAEFARGIDPEELARDMVREKRTDDVQRQANIDESLADDGTLSGTILKGLRQAQYNDGIRTRASKNEASKDQTLYLEILSQLEQAGRDLKLLNERVDEEAAKLREKYGGIDRISSTFLTEEERAGLKTEAEIYEAMVAKFLNEDGSLKAGAENVDPEVIEFLQLFQERQSKAEQVREMAQDIRESGAALTEEQKSAMEEVTTAADPWERVDMINEASDAEEIVETIDKENSLEMDVVPSTGGFSL